MEQRQSDFQQALKKADSSIREFEAETNQRLIAQQKELVSRLDAQAGSLYQDLASLQSNLQDQMAEMIEYERQARQDQFNRLEEDIEKIGDHHNRMRDLAFSWLGSTLKIDEFIASEYPHEFFAPGRLQQLSREIILASQNMGQGANEAGLAQVQQAYFDLSDFRLELERLETEWRLWQQAVLDGIRHLYACLQNNISATAVDMAGKELEVTIDVNAWTGGGLDDISSGLNDLGELVQSGFPSVDTATLQHIARSVLPAYQQQIEQTVEAARLTALSSQVRINIADLVVQALEDQGYVLQDASYGEGNPTSEYRAALQSLDGCEVEILVSPVDNLPVNNELSIISHDREQKSEHELRQRAREVAKSLQHYGLNVGNFQVMELTQDYRLPSPAVGEEELAGQAFNQKV